jgi:hypothetical protein
MKSRLFRLWGSCLLAVWLLSACAGGYLLDNDVTAFSHLSALPAQPTYRFDRLPSQQMPEQARLEALADPALHAAGLRRDDAAPRYTVQVDGKIRRILSPWSDRKRGGGWGPMRIGVGFNLGVGFSGGDGGWDDPDWYRREASVIVRELPSNRVVFESSAVNEGPWVEDQKIFAAMFQAAMQGFPAPPPGPRRVDIPVGR